MRSSLLAVLACGTSLVGQPSPTYYAAADTSSAVALRQTLHDVIDDHRRFPYTSSSTDTWNILERADEDPSNPGNILDLNKNASYPKQGGGNSFYNRDHIWPKSFGYPRDNSSNYPYTDCHTLFLSDSAYNNSRSNKLYDSCAGCSEKTTLFNAGVGGGSGLYPGNSNWTSGSVAPAVWEQWRGRRGDVARSLFYMDVRYEGGLHGVTGAGEPDLILTDDTARVLASSTGQNETVAYFGLVSVLLQWHREDPVDAVELQRNDVVFSFQGNRNPFIDNPQWVECLFAGLPMALEISRLGAPANPAALLTGQSSAPRLGNTWDPVIDHASFMTGAITDVLVLAAAPTNAPTLFGTLLCDLSSPSVYLTTTPGTPFGIPIPSACSFAGVVFCAQGISVDALGGIGTTNALDVTLGY